MFYLLLSLLKVKFIYMPSIYLSISMLVMIFHYMFPKLFKALEKDNKNNIKT